MLLFLLENPLFDVHIQLNILLCYLLFGLLLCNEPTTDLFAVDPNPCASTVAPAVISSETVPRYHSLFFNVALIQVKRGRAGTSVTLFARCCLPSLKTWLQLMREERSLTRTATRPCRVTTDTMLMKWRSGSPNTSLES